MKITKRLFSLMLALLMMVSLFPAAALAEESPAFTVQPVSGSHAPGESYALTWALNRVPDQLELVRVATEDERAVEDTSPYDADESLLVLVRELEPESTALELTAPAEETVFYLRAWYGEEALLSEGFTVTVDLSSPERGGAEQGEAEESGPLSQLPEELTAPLAGEPIETEVDTSSGADAPPSPQGEGTEAKPAEPIADEPQVERYFTVQPQSGVCSTATLKYTATWETNFTPWMYRIMKKNSIGEFINYQGSTNFNELKAFTYDFPSESRPVTYCIYAYYGEGNEDYVPSNEFTVSPAGNPDDYVFTTQPQGGSYSTSTLEYRIIWQTNFVPVQVEIQENVAGYGFATVQTFTDIDFTSGWYNAPAKPGSTTYRIRAFYGTGSADYITSNEISVTADGVFSFTTQPESGSYSPSTLEYLITWETNFVPLKLEVQENQPYFGFATIETFTNLDFLSGWYHAPAKAGSTSYRIRAFYGTENDAYIESDVITVTADGVFQFVNQPESGCCDPDTLEYLIIWETNFVPLKVEVQENQPYFGFATIETFTDPGFSSGWYHATVEAGSTSYRIRAFYGTEDEDYITSDTCVVTDEPPATSGDCGAENPEDVHWELDVESGVLSFTGSGAMQDFTERLPPWYYYRKIIKTVNVGTGITAVGSYAFCNCPNFTQVNLPYALTSIGDYAFDKCPALAKAWISMAQSTFEAKVIWDKAKNAGLDAAAKVFNSIATGICGDDLTWTINNNGTLSIDGTGPMYDWDNASETPWYPYRSQILSISMGGGGTSIGKNAFHGLTNVSSAATGFDVTSIGANAFQGCTAMKTVNIRSNNVDIPNYCFSGCTSLKSVTIPKGAGSIGHSAFRGCRALSTVTFPSGSALSQVGPYAFAECGALSSINLPDSVNGLGDHAFYNDKSLTSLTLPANLMSMGAYCFCGCSGITGTVTLIEGMTRIPERCFLGCGFNKIVLPTTLTEVGLYAFSGCTKLSNVSYDGFRSQWEQQVTVAGGNDLLLNASFSWLYRSGRVSNTDTYWQLYGGPGKLVIYGTGNMANYPGTPEAAPWYKYAPYIQVIDVHEGVTLIGAYAFCGTTALITVYLPESLTTIGSAAFRNSSALTDVWYNASQVIRQEKLTISTVNSYLEKAHWHYADIGGTVDGTDLWWSVNEEGLLRIYWDDDAMDQSEMAIPDYQDKIQTPWYVHGNGQLYPMIYSIQVDELVTRIGDNAFSELSEVTTMQISSSVTSIGEGAFRGCTCLDAVTIPDSVTSLDNCIFWNCESLEDATLPAGLTEIPYGTFYGCENLSTVYIPGTVTSIGNNAFSGCDRLAAGGDVWFDGTSAQWAAITRGSGNEALNTATLHFNPPEIKVDEVNFPDPAFRAYVAEWIDIDGSGWLCDDERLAAENIYCNELGIQSLQGIAFFPNLTHLDCSGNALSGTLDLSDNVKLQAVYCQNNDLDELDLTGLTELDMLICSGNPLSGLDLSTNVDLAYLDVTGCGLGALDLSANHLLTELYCRNNSLTALDLSHTQQLTDLDCANNEIETLDLSVCPGLRYVDCSDNCLMSLTLGVQPQLKRLYCQTNELTELHLSNALWLIDNMIHGTCTDTGLYLKYENGSNALWMDPGLDMDGIPINAYIFPDANFRAYVAANCDPNEDLWLSWGEIEDVVTIACQDLEIASLQGVGYFTGLKYLYCNDNQIAELDLSANGMLTDLNCDCNQLQSLDLSSLTRLTSLSVGCNPELTGLDLSHNPLLRSLDCRECAITALDLRPCTLLEELLCYDNALTALDLSGLRLLRCMECYDNQITSLDLSGCQSLVMADCHDNALTELTLGHLPELKELYCQHNSLASLDVFDCDYLADIVLTTEQIEYDDYVYYTKDACEFALDPDVILILDHNGIPVDEEHFPDPAFRAYVAAELDLSHNGYLNAEEIEAATDIVCDGLGIVSLQGIQYFTALSYLDCMDNQITEMDLSQNLMLSYLDCGGNPLTALDVSGNPALSSLSCGSCLIESLDLSQNGKLSSVFCDYNPGLTELLLPPGETLSWLYCSNCALTSLDLCTCTGLTTVHCDHNALTELILGEQLKLNHLYCQHNSLANLDIFNCPLLMALAATEGVTADGVTTYSGSVVLCVDEITVLVEDHDGIPVDEEHFPDPAFRAYVAANLDTSHNGWLNEAEINAVEQIDVSGMGIETLQGVRYFSSLEELVCFDNHLTELDLEGLNLLYYLDANCNRFTSLDLSASPSLTMVELGGTPTLTSLNVDGLTQLDYLDVSACGLTVLDVSFCRSLQSLYVYSSPALEGVTLGENEILFCFYAYNTENLSELDISGCTHLAAAYLDGPDSVEDGVAWYYGTAELSCEMALDPGQAVIAETQPSHKPGDINGDGKVNTADVTLLAKYVKARGQGVDIVPGAGNVDGSADGRITTADVALLAKYVKARGQGVVIY